MSAPAPRHQATLFLPEPVAGVVNRVRAKWDPEMARRISAHVTLVHDASPVELVIERLRRAATSVPSFRLVLGTTTCWDSPDGGIYIAVDDIDGGVATLRNHVMVPPLAEPAGVEYAPHVTVVHPRSVAPARRHEAWEQLRGWRVDSEFVVNEVTLIREDAGAWSSVERVVLG